MTAGVVAAEDRGGSPILVIVLLLAAGLGMLMSRISPHVGDGTQGVPRTADIQPDGGTYENQLPERLDDAIEKLQKWGAKHVGGKDSRLLATWGQKGGRALGRTILKKVTGEVGGLIEGEVKGAVKGLVDK